MTAIDSTNTPATDELLEYARRLTACGYYTQSDISQMLQEYVEDDGAQEAVKERVASALEQAVALQLKEQEADPAVTDYDTLRQAFGRLESEGYLVRENFTCCQTCGWSEADSELEDAAKAGRPFKGVVFFHQQDTESAVDGGGLFLAYGGEQGSDAAGQQVVQAFEAAGLAAVWNGSAKTRICVPMTWQRRFDPTA
jgi:predicted Zn-ribbon and HTH transcriptional regulator